MLSELVCFTFQAEEHANKCSTHTCSQIARNSTESFISGTTTNLSSSIIKKVQGKNHQPSCLKNAEVNSFPKLNIMLKRCGTFSLVFILLTSIAFIPDAMP